MGPLPPPFRAGCRQIGIQRAGLLPGGDDPGVDQRLAYLRVVLCVFRSKAVGTQLRPSQRGFGVAGCPVLVSRRIGGADPAFCVVFG